MINADFVILFSFEDTASALMPRGYAMICAVASCVPILILMKRGGARQ